MTGNYKFIFLFPIIFLLPSISCSRREDRDEIARYQSFAEIVQREDGGGIGTDGFFEKNLLANPYPEVRRWSAIALGRIGSPEGLPLLYQSLHADDAAVRAASAFAIGEIEDREGVAQRREVPDPRAAAELIRLLNDPSLAVRHRVVEALGKIGSHAEAAEIERQLGFFHFNGEPAERAFIESFITALVKLNQTAAAPAIQKLANARDPEIRWRALDALIRLNDTSAGPLFTENLNNPNDEVRFHAARGLGIIGTPETKKMLAPLSLSLHESESVSSKTNAFYLALAAGRKYSTIAIVETNRGTIEIELFREDAPVTAAHFVLMANGGAYNNMELTQAPQQRLVEGTVSGNMEKFASRINSEVNMRPFERGSVGMALAGRGSDTGRFFIALAPQPYMDGMHTCFGRVISGMQAADRIVAGDRVKCIRIKETIGLLQRQIY